MMVVQHQDVELAVDEVDHHLLELALAASGRGRRRRASPRARCSRMLAPPTSSMVLDRGCARRTPARRAPARARSPRAAGRRSQRQTKVRIARRSAGGVAMIEISRSPPIAMCSVRGIGVAVSVSTSTCVRSSLSRSLCVTPKRCSSSMTSRPRSLKRTSARQQAVRADDDVDLALGQRPRRSRVCSALLRKRDSDADAAPGSRAKRSAKVTKCCSASTVVGASTATCLPPSTASRRRAAPPRSCRSRRRRRPGGPSAARLHVAEHVVDRLLPGRASPRTGRSPRTRGTSRPARGNACPGRPARCA